MKILITGVYSCGKTTLVRQLAAVLAKGDPSSTTLIRPDLARDCPLPLNKDQTMHSSFWLAGQIMSIESELLAKSPDFLICDRSIPDIVSHSDACAEPTRGLPALSELEILSKSWTNTYDLVFRAHPDPRLPINSDGLRVDELEYQSHLDDLLTHSLSRCDISYTDLPHDVNSRIEVVTGQIDALRTQS